MAVFDKNKGLKAKLGKHIYLITVISVLIVALSACFLTALTNQNQMERTVSAQLEDCSMKLQSWLEEKISLTEFIGDEVVDRGYAENRGECLPFLQDCLARDDDCFEVYVAYSDKSILFASGATAPEGFDPTTRGWYLNAAASDGVVVTDPYTDAVTGRMVITCAKKIEVNGQVVGALGRDIFIDEVADIINSLHIDENGYAMLVTESGDIIVHQNEEYMPKVDASGSDVFTNLSDVMQGYSTDMEAGKIIKLKDYTNKNVNFAQCGMDLLGWKLGYALNYFEYHRNTTTIIVLFIIMVFVFSVIISTYLTILLKKVFKPLEDVAQTAQRVSQGDLSVSFNYSGNDEIGAVCQTIEVNNRVMRDYIEDIAARLDGISRGDFKKESNVEYRGDYAAIKNSLDNISSSLGQVFDGIEGASEAVFGGAGGVANGANQLAESVSMQTAVINEIVNEVNIVSEKITNNVSRTDEARSLAKDTADSVQDSSEQMNKLLDAMNEISKASEEIKKIIGTIEDIAFQTNILALNASVEAARAGAAGKGFAVVADEVRNLAGKSAEASVQTSKLIEHSTEAVSSGLKFAEAASDSLKKVVEHTNEIDGIIVKINEESHDQSSCMDDVNSKIGVVADYVSSAAANAEESAAASQELNGQASALKEMLQNFGE